MIVLQKYEKNFLSHLKSSFRSRDIQIFVFPSSPFFSLSAIIYRSCRPKVFCKKGVLRNFAKFSGKHLRQSLFFKKDAGSPASSLIKRLWHKCFSANFTKFFYEFLQNTSDGCFCNYEPDARKFYRSCFLGNL